MDKDRFWTEQLMLVNKSFFFGMDFYDGREKEEEGIQKLHEYTVLEAREIDNHLLLKIKFVLLCDIDADFLTSLGIRGARLDGRALGAMDRKNGLRII